MYKIALKDIYYVSGFGVTTCWVAPAEFSKAEADPLAAFSQQLVDDWNANRQADFQSLAQAFFGHDLDVDQVDSPRITFLDRFGFDFRFRFPRKDVASKSKSAADADKQVPLCCLSMGARRQLPRLAACRASSVGSRERRLRCLEALGAAAGPRVPLCLHVCRFIDS